MSGAQFQNLVESLADRLYRADGGRDNPHARTRAQCRLDALLALVGLEPAPVPAPDAARAHANGHSAAADCNSDPEPSGAIPGVQPRSLWRRPVVASWYRPVVSRWYRPAGFCPASASPLALASPGPSLAGTARSTLPGVGEPARSGAGSSLAGTARSTLPGVGEPARSGAGSVSRWYQPGRLFPGAGEPARPAAPTAPSRSPASVRAYGLRPAAPAGVGSAPRPSSAS